MMLSIGTDIVHVHRFVPWTVYKEKKLLRIFTHNELLDCFSNHLSTYIPERLAVRFAAKEAFFKALSSMVTSLYKTQNPLSFISSCSRIWVEKNIWNIPQMGIDWKFFQDTLQQSIPIPYVTVSLTHDKDYAVAFIIIQDTCT